MKKKELMPYLFLAPAVFFILAFLAYPLLTVFFYSVQSYDVTKIADKGFVGFKNFKTLFADKIFYRSLTGMRRSFLRNLAMEQRKRA